MRAILAALAIALTVAVARPATAAAKSCSVGNSRAYNTTYVIKITVTGVSCSAGKSLIRSYHTCRPGRSGKCARIKGYRCTERRYNKSPQSYDSDVKCTRGSTRVAHTYTQFI